jgi:hypothetical protein
MLSKRTSKEDFKKDDDDDIPQPLLAVYFVLFGGVGLAITVVNGAKTLLDDDKSILLKVIRWPVAVLFGALDDKDEPDAPAP